MIIPTPLPGVVSDRRGPGRPRTTEHDERILEAAVTMLERGEEVTVNRLVVESGVSRAAIYRRWPSTTDLLAAALDRGRSASELPLDGDLLENLLRAYTAPDAPGGGFSVDRLRLRIKLAMSDPKLAHAYWQSHAGRRRGVLVALLTEGIRRGELRPDLDVDAGIDLINGVFYYQFVVRGQTLNDPGVAERCAEAVRIAWRGMSAHSG